MEADWERKNPWVHLDLEGVRSLLPGIDVAASRLIAEGRVSTNYLLDTLQGRLVLRIDPDSYGKREFSALSPDDVPVAPLYDRSERYEESPVWRLYVWRPERSLEAAILERRSLPYDRIARQLARVRLSMNRVRCAKSGFFDGYDPSYGSRFHNGSPSTEPLEVVSPWPSAVEGLLRWLRRRLPAATLPGRLDRRLLRTLEDAEPRLQAIAGPPVLVHGDYKPSNLIVDDGGLTAVIDWEFAHAGTWLSDVGQLLRHPESLPPGFAGAFLEAIDAPPDTAILARTLDLVNLVAFLADRDDRPRMRAGILPRIVEVCDLYDARFAPLP